MLYHGVNLVRTFAIIAVEIFFQNKSAVFYNQYAVDVLVFIVKDRQYQCITFSDLKPDPLRSKLQLLLRASNAAGGEFPEFIFTRTLSFI